MTKPISIFIMAAIVPALAGAFFVAVPSLQSDEAILNAEIGPRVERARRLLFAHGANQERLSDILESLKAQGVDVELMGEGAERVLEENRDVVDEVVDALADRSRGPHVNNLKAIEQRYAEVAGGEPTSLLPSGGLGRNINAIITSARQGIAARDRILAENRKLLTEALQEVDAAIAMTRGSASGAQHVDANRIKGVVLAAQAAAKLRDARRGRALRDDKASTLASLVSEAGRLDIERDLVDRSAIRDALDAMNEQADEVKRLIAEREAAIATIESTIADLERRIAALRSDAQETRSKMDAMEEDGADLLDPRGAAVFAEAYATFSDRYREVSAAADRLEHGTLEDARIDDSGDYVTGSFVPQEPGGAIVERRGLVDFRHDLATASADVAGARETLSGLEEQIEELASLAEQYAERSAEAAAGLSTLRSRATDAYNAFETAASDADSFFEQAARKARSAVQALRVAGGAAASRAREAGDRINTLSPTSQGRSPFKLASEDKWLAAQLNNETGQSRYLLGVIHHARFVAADDDQRLATWAKASLELALADPATFADRREAARDAGIEALRSASGDFERSFRGLNSNWTIPAEAAAAHYLLSLLEHPDHLQSAVQNYQKAVANIPDHPSAQPIIDRLEQLTRR